MGKELSKESQMAQFILTKCEEFGCQGANDTMELLAGATLLLLCVTGDFLGVPFDEMRKEYIRGISEATVEAE